MYLQTKAIVLHRTPYNDRYSIVHLYTLDRGRVGVLQANKRTKRKDRGSLLLNPLSELELVLELKPRRELAYIKDFKMINPNHNIHSNPYKCSQALLLGELLYRCLTESVEDEPLYHFISSSLTFFAYMDKGIANFYLCFMWLLLRFLAVEPMIELRQAECLEQGLYFDIDNGELTATQKLGHSYLSVNESAYLCLFSRINYNNLQHFQLNRLQRSRILDCLVQYYQIHIPNFKKLHSIDVLRSMSNR